MPRVLLKVCITENLFPLIKILLIQFIGKNTSSLNKLLSPSERHGFQFSKNIDTKNKLSKQKQRKQSKKTNPETKI